MRYDISATNVIHRQNKYCTNLEPIEKSTNFKVLLKKNASKNIKWTSKNQCVANHTNNPNLCYLKSYAFKGFGTLSK